MPLTENQFVASRSTNWRASPIVDCCAAGFRTKRSSSTSWPPASSGCLRDGRTSLLLIFGLVIIATVLCYKLFFSTYDRKLHVAVNDEFTKLFPSASIYIGRVSRSPGGRIIASNVRIAQEDTKPKQEILKAQRIELAGRLDLIDWAQGTLTVEQADIYGMQLDAWIDAAGNWSISTLVPKSAKHSRPPKINIYDATVRLLQDSTPNAKSIALHHISGTIAPASSPPTSTQPINAEREAGIGQAAPTIVHANFRGSGGGTIDQFDINIGFDTVSKRWRSLGNINGLQLSRAMLRRLPTQLQSHLKQLEGLECEAQANFEVQGSPASPPLYKLRGKLENGRLVDAQLPYALEELNGLFFCENSKIQFRDVTATNSDNAKLSLLADISGVNALSGLTQNSHIKVLATAQNLELDQALRRALPKHLQEQWDKLQLHGRVSGKITMEHDGTKWTPTLAVDCHNVSMTPWLFPFPLTEFRGHVTYQNSRVSGHEITAIGGGQQLAGSFSLQKIEAEWLGKLNMRSHGPIPIDERLISAFTPRGEDTTGAEKFVRQLQPEGKIQLTQAEFSRDSLYENWHRTIDARIFNGSINYKNFPYPIREIVGRVYAKDSDWWLDKFEGKNDSGFIQCSGWWNSGAAGQVPFELDFNAHSLPLADELKLALSEDVQSVWDELRPSGSIDSVSIRLARSEYSLLQTNVTVSEKRASNSNNSRKLSIHPRSFPYALSDVECEIDYTPGLVTIRKASGRNGASLLALEGTCQPLPDGRWAADVAWKPQTSLLVERELLKALPESIRDSLVKVDFRGSLGIVGKSQIIFPKKQDDYLESFWSCKLAVEKGQFAEGRNIGNLRGTIEMRGHSDGKQLNARGNLALDALTFVDIPVTRLKGPFAISGSNMFFGEDVLPQPGEESVPITANAPSGQIVASGQFSMNDEKLYLEATLTDAQLSVLLADLGVDAADTEAVCNANVKFSGVPWNQQTYQGGGAIHLTDANLYQLPFMIRIMRVAAVNAKNASAFQSADINFTIDGNRIPILVACDGNVLRLKGSGEVTLAREVDLELLSYVGRRRQVSKVVSPILPGSRFAAFMLIEVKGTLDNPQMVRRPFPQIENAIQQWFPELAEREEPLLRRNR